MEVPLLGADRRFRAARWHRVVVVRHSHHRRLSSYFSLSALVTPRQHHTTANDPSIPCGPGTPHPAIIGLEAGWQVRFAFPPPLILSVASLPLIPSLPALTAPLPLPVDEHLLL